MNQQDDAAETTLRALVDGKDLGRKKLPDAVEIEAADAQAIARWAQGFSGVCMTNLDIHLGDIKPSNGMRLMGEIDKRIARRIKPLFAAAEIHGFALRLARDTTNDPYRLEIVRRVIDAKQLTIAARSMRHFMTALGLHHATMTLEDHVVDVDMFEKVLERRERECMDAGVGHYHSYARQIVAFARANNTDRIVWGRERRGVVAS